ncbi:MAG: DUF6157 family protein [Gemmatimonadota bacterium]|jgi:hypothetical protein|nr:DUF6157 family protein [Gemmatimonadota bacterium]
MIHSTNYTSTFIHVAEDCPAAAGEVPPEKTPPTVARMQYDMISRNPYRYTSDEVIFAVHAARKEIPPEELAAERAAFFSRGQPCLRTSPLGKRYGWGIHHDPESRIAIYARDSEEYTRLSGDPGLKQVKGMKRS